MTEAMKVSKVQVLHNNQLKIALQEKIQNFKKKLSDIS